ncbi:unnamed protein product [Effrenium voratum]|nr:unnamed protein product [Effrenium voratum]
MASVDTALAASRPPMLHSRPSLAMAGAIDVVLAQTGLGDAELAFLAASGRAVGASAQPELQSGRAVGQESLEMNRAIYCDSNPEIANWRALGQGLPHRDAFAPSRTARRLAEWAWGLPKTWPTSEAETSATLQDILTDQSLGGALALAVLDADDEASAIVCVEGVGGIERLRVVGAVANPLAPESQSLCEDAVREVQAIASR